MIINIIRIKNDLLKKLRKNFQNLRKYQRFLKNLFKF